jgi:hypothetical protein
VTTTGPSSHTGGVPHFADRLGHDPGGKRLGDRNLVSSREWLVKRSKATRISAAPPRGTPAGTAWLRPRPRVHRPDPGPGRTGREGVYLDEIADRAGIPESETRGAAARPDYRPAPGHRAGRQRHPRPGPPLRGPPWFLNRHPCSSVLVAGPLITLRPTGRRRVLPASDPGTGR